MAMSEKLQLFAKAKTLGVEGYRSMSADELKKAIKGASATSPAKGKTAAKSASKNGAAPKKGSARKTAVKTARKVAAKVTKGASKKSAPKSAAKTSGRKSSVKSAPAAQAKRSASGAGRIAIVNSNIDWQAESNVGQSGGNRQVIMKLLRSKKGDVAKVFNALADKAQTMYGKTNEGRRRSKGDAQALLRWHISRVKFDFVKDTGQHNGITRSNGGSKATPARKTTAKKSGGSKVKGTTRKAQTTAQARKPARGKSKATASKSKGTAASRKRK